MSDAVTYSIIRYYENPDLGPELVTTGLTLDQAQAHCNNPETSSETATGDIARRRTAEYGRWFDGYTREAGF